MIKAETAQASTPELLNATEFRQRLGLGSTRFYELRALGKFKAFEVCRPIGNRRYARVLVDQYVAGESVAKLGRRI